MAANIIVRNVSITPNPVDTASKYKVSVSVEEMNNFAYVGNYVGSYVNIMNSEIQDKLAISYVGDFTKQ